MALTEEGIIKVPGMNSRWVRLSDGQRAHYVTIGETGPAVVLLHGGIPGSSGAAGWRYVAPMLAERGFRVYCPDQPGFGLSDPRPEYRPVHGVYTHINFLERFAEALCLDEFYLSGNSMGCLNTSHYVVRHPHRVKAFVLVAGPVGDVMPFPTADRLTTKVGWDGNRETMIRMLSSIVYRKETTTEDILDMRMRAADVHKEGWTAWAKAYLFNDLPADIKAALSTRGRLDVLETPGLCLYGMNDEILPVTDLGYQVEDALPKIQFFYPEECGHQGQTDRPELFADVLAEFFGTGRVSRATADRAGVSKRRPEIAALVEAVDTAARPAPVGS